MADGNTLLIRSFEGERDPEEVTVLPPWLHASYCLATCLSRLWLSSETSHALAEGFFSRAVADTALLRFLLDGRRNSRYENDALLPFVER